MPLLLAPLTVNDALSWTRIRSAAYAGPTNVLIHTTVPVSESTYLGVAKERKKEIGKPNSWQWKVVDTELAPSKDDPEDNGGRTIAIAIWSACNVNLSADAKKVVDGGETKGEGEASNEHASVPGEMNPSLNKKDPEEEEKPFVPPELKVDILMALLTPLREAQASIMGSKPYLMLNTLATHPDHHKRGAATMLLKWGLERADELGLDMYLDTSRVARPIYEKYGFELVKGIEFDRRPWGGEGIDWHGCMVRKPGSSKESTTQC